MCTNEQIDSILKKISVGMENFFGNKLESIILYGSYARGDFNNDSDIDIMVIVDMDKHKLAKYRRNVISFLQPIEFEYEILISIHLQDFATFENWRNDLPYYINVIREGIVINAE